MNPLPVSGSAPVYSVVGDRYTFLLTGSQTDGAYFVFEAFVLPGNGTPPHIHHREDEAFNVIDGEFEFIIAGEAVRVGAGGFVFGRRDIPHHFRNVGSVPGRMIVTVTPAGIVIGCFPSRLIRYQIMNSCSPPTFFSRASASARTP
jgi:mannose-6-phosphate isomerase-like protein (cupin superfamily)